MTTANSTRKRPAKPYPEFPLFAHRSGQWARKIAGKLHYFGKWDNPTAALEKHNAEYSSRKEGIALPDSYEGWRVDNLVNEFLSIQEDRADLGEIQRCTFEALEHVGKLVVEFIKPNRAVESLRPNDFRKLRSGLIKRYSPVNARVIMGRVRAIFKFAYEEQLIERPVIYGRGFDLPTKSVIRKARNAKPKKLFTPEQVKLLIQNASPALKAMVLLSLNTGMNNADLANLKQSHINFKSGWLDYPRHKTGIERRAKLWPETINAVSGYLPERQEPLSDHAEFLFITKARRQWGYSSLPSEFRKLIDRTNSRKNSKGEPIRTPKLKANGEPMKSKYTYQSVKKPPIPHGSFGYFRHSFETVAGGSRDQVAVNAIMGHVDPSMSAEYRETIEDDRLEAVAEHVRQWLFSSEVA